jgi:chemotaxis protein methyltransferase CheR
MTPHEFDDIRQLAYRTFGLDLKHGKEEMASARLQRLVAAGGFRSFHDYHRHVIQDSTGRSLAALVDALTTNHTSFLRERDHFDGCGSHPGQIAVNMLKQTAKTWPDWQEV